MITFLIIGLILLNGIFSMAEMALISARKYKLENALKKGKSGAAVALELYENPTKLISTAQIGITVIAVLLGFYGDDAYTVNLENFFNQFDMLKGISHRLAVFGVLFIITFANILLGELLPKKLGLTFPEPIAIQFARPMKIVSILASPFVWLLTASNNFLLGLFGIKKNIDSKVSEEEIKSIIKDSAEGGEIEEIEHDIVERVFELGDRKVKTLYTHRSDIVFFDEKDDWNTIREKINNEKHSAYPLCRNNNIDEIVGIVLLKDLFAPSNKEEFNINDFVRQPLFCNESTFAYKLLELFKKAKMHYGIVIDEYGATKGIITMDDVVDALIGDVSEEDHDEYQIIARDENSWLVDGQYSIIDFIKYFDIDLEEELDEQYTTLAGFLMHQSSSLPNVGDVFEHWNYKFEIVDKDGHRIDKIMLTKL